MRKCIWLFMIMITSFLQLDHVGSTTHLSPYMQKLALFQFKLSFTVNTSAPDHAYCDFFVPSHPKTMNWSMSSDCCTWDGVTCYQMTGDVIGLDLSCSQLVGAIPPNSTLFQLSHLQFLDFGSNYIHGVLPQEIFHLPNLKALSLSYNSNLSISLPTVKWGSTDSLQMLSITQTTLSGGIPDSLGYLTSLTSLSLSGCKISGPIPRFMGNLTGLAYLELDDNHLSGQIPDSLANLQNLTHLSLMGNNLIGQFPSWVANLRQLESLELSMNLLSGPLPSNLTALSLPKLAYLRVWSNSLNGTIPSWLFHLPSIRNLNVGSNMFTGQLHEINSFSSSLQSFDCSDNSLSGTIPQFLTERVNLTSLDFSSNNFSGVLDVEAFSHLENLDHLLLSNISLRFTDTTKLPPNLYYLVLSSCKIMKFPNFLRSVKNLGHLDLSYNQIDGQIPHWIGSIGRDSLYFMNLSHNSITAGLQHLPWNRLDYLDVQYNMLSGSVPASICNSSNLSILNLSHNNLTGVLPECPRSLDNFVSVLDLRENSIGGSLPSTLSNFRKLRSLNLHGNKLEGTIPVSFAEFEYLEVLDLGRNRINDTFPQCLEALTSLQILVLKSNKFHGFISNNSKTEHPFPSLRVIDLSDNEFSGLLPAKYIKSFKGMMNGDVNKVELAYMGVNYYRDSISIVIKGVEHRQYTILTVFTTIDLSRNKFEGKIPEDIGNLKSLRQLNISHNHLMGNIPSSVGKLLMLEVLDLSFNQLVGKIPQQLTSAHSLSRLNLSHNRLGGHIPEGAQFNTFENDSYAGNLGLCGPPLSKKCEIEITEAQEEEEDEDDDYFFSGFTWKAVVIGYGGGVVVGFVVGYMMFMAGRPKWFTGIIDRGELGFKVRRMEITRFA